MLCVFDAVFSEPELIICQLTSPENSASDCWETTWWCWNCLRINREGRKGIELEVSTKSEMLLALGWLACFKNNFQTAESLNFVMVSRTRFSCRARYGIEEMCRDQWNWASKNPYGYGSPDSNNNWKPILITKSAFNFLVQFSSGHSSPAVSKLWPLYEK